jgi:hypothetical protein
MNENMLKYNRADSLDVWGSGCRDTGILDFHISWKWSGSRPGRFTSEEKAHGTHWVGSWMGPRTGLQEKNLVPTGIQAVQPVVSRYSDWAIPAPDWNVTYIWGIE